MSKKPGSDQTERRVVVVVGNETPSPIYRYQSYCGKSGHLSATPAEKQPGKIAALQNINL